MLDARIRISGRFLRESYFFLTEYRGFLSGTACQEALSGFGRICTGTGYSENPPGRSSAAIHVLYLSECRRAILKAHPLPESVNAACSAGSARSLYCCIQRFPWCWAALCRSAKIYECAVEKYKGVTGNAGPKENISKRVRNPAPILRRLNTRPRCSWDAVR